MNDILLRAITGALFVILVLGSIWYGDYANVVLFTTVLTLGLIEFYRLFKKDTPVELSWFQPTVAGLIIFGMLVILPMPFNFIIFPTLFIFMLIELWRKKDNPILNLGIFFLGLLYLVVPFFLMTKMSLGGTESRWNLICMFLLIWTNDTFAYLSGRLFGRTKLFERISPKKTWEGTLGGIVFTLIVAWLTGTYIDPESGIRFWIPAALIIAPCAIFGDLLESLFKRSLHIKDSGNILPGHGGILDRFDAALMATPFFFCWSYYYTYF